MEQFIQVLIEASSSFSWCHWLLVLGIAGLSGGFGKVIVIAIKEFDVINPALSFIIFIVAIIMLAFAYLCATPFLNYPAATEVQITIISWSILWFLIGLNMPIINKDSND